MSIKLIIFDFDGTLGDTRRNIVVTMQDVMKELSLPLQDEDVCASTIGLPLKGCYAKMFPQLNADELERCDILMGANARTKTCGVTWGNGTREELKEAGADFIIDRMEDLIEITSNQN